jgi:hypothetical protein
MARSVKRKCVIWIAHCFLAIAASLLSTSIGSAETSPLGCGDFSTLLDDGIPVAVALQNAASKQAEASLAEAACREALRVDPANPAAMFQFARALALANKHMAAVKYYLDAADRGHAGAMNDLGGIFEYGIGVPKNLATATEWYERAAGAGHMGAMAHLGELSENAGGVGNLANAKQWYEKAAMLGDAVSMNSLANLLKQAGELPAAVDWYGKAARHGLASAMNSLGELSEAGTGLPQDYASARSWYRKAADLGDADAMGRLGAMLESGRGGPQDLDAAREWHVKGAARNGRIAMHNLGVMLEHGRGTAKNLSEARLWYERAAALEYPPALTDLGRLHLDGAAVPKNYARARSLFERASALGDARAMNNLGLLYLYGRGVLRDIKEARAWFERAAVLNDTEARQNLDRLDQAGLTDGTQIAARRTACVQTCAALQRSFVSSVCEHHSSTSIEENPERTKCIEMSLTVTKQCRDTCREWASTLSSDNRCLTCFRSLIACSVSQESFRQGDERPYAEDAKGCLGSLADCMTSCSRQTTSSGTAD